MRLPLWLKFQRLSLFIYFAAGVLLLVYALGFISDVYIFYAYGNKALADFYHDMQKINSGLLWNAILAIVFVMILFLLELGRRPAGKITLAVVIVIAVTGILICANTFILLLNARGGYTALDLSSLNRYIERGAINYKYSTLTWDLGLTVYALFLLSSLFMVITVIRNAFTVKETAVVEEGK